MPTFDLSTHNKKRTIHQLKDIKRYRIKRNVVEKSQKTTYGLERSHGEQVGHHSGETRCQATLRDESQLEFGQANDVVTTLPIPTGDVQQVGLVGRKQEMKCVDSKHTNKQTNKKVGGKSYHLWLFVSDWISAPPHPPCRGPEPDHGT